MAVDYEAKTPMYPKDQYNYDKLDLSQLKMEVDVADINQYENEVYALLRKRGLGTSDASAICGVNPYVSYSDLIQEKCRDYLTQEEKEVGDKVAVRKGRDLEPFIINRFAQMMGRNILKPSDMYRHKDYPWLKFNFDGVIDKVELNSGRYQYIPAEIKVVTRYGLKHYDRTKAWWRESTGYLDVLGDFSKSNNSIETKAAYYGIPPYYYTQLQQQIFGLDAPFGYLTVLSDSDWELMSFFVYRDDACISQILTQGYKAVNKIIQITKDPNHFDVAPVLEGFKNEKRKSAYTVLPSE